MSSFRFIHCADLHLGSRFSELSSFDPAKGKRLHECTFEALDRIIDLSKEENVDFIVFAGDVFDENVQSPGTRHRFAEALKRANIPCYISYGNHDYKRNWEESIPFPVNAHVFSFEGNVFEYISDGEHIANISGVSYNKRNHEDLSDRITGNDSIFTVGVLHCDVSEDGGEGYAPCSLNTLINKNVDYWALGHVHTRVILNEKPFVGYPGNTQGRNPRETGEKGVFLVDVKDGNVKTEFRKTHSVRWETITADITGKDAHGLLEDLKAAIPEKGCMVRLHLTGNGNLNNMIRTHEKEFLELVSNSTGCTIVGFYPKTGPAIDLDEKRKAGDFISSVILTSDKLETEDRNSIIDIICSTTAAKPLCKYFEEMDDEELKSIVRDASMYLVEKLTEVKG